MRRRRAVAAAATAVALPGEVSLVCLPLLPPPGSLQDPQALLPRLGAVPPLPVHAPRLALDPLPRRRHRPTHPLAADRSQPLSASALRRLPGAAHHSRHHLPVRGGETFPQLQSDCLSSSIRVVGRAGGESGGRRDRPQVQETGRLSPTCLILYFVLLLIAAWNSPSKGSNIEHTDNRDNTSRDS